MNFTIKSRLIGLNEYVNISRRNRFASAKVKREQQDIVSVFVPRGTKMFHAPVKIIFNWFEPNRKRDIDNVSFAKKFILDCLVTMNVLIDDSQKYVVKLEDNVFVDRKNPRIEVEIIEL